MYESTVVFYRLATDTDICRVYATYHDDPQYEASKKSVQASLNSFIFAFLEALNMDSSSNKTPGSKEIQKVSVSIGKSVGTGQVDDASICYMICRCIPR